MYLNNYLSKNGCFFKFVRIMLFMKNIVIVFFCFLLLACSESSTEPEVFDASRVCPENKRGSFVDDRDGQVYKYTTIGNQVWMAENLNYKMESGSYDAYSSSCSSVEDNCDGRGLSYSYDVVLEACPKGWHLPEQKEWDKLIEKMGGAEIAGERLKAVDGWHPLNRDDPLGGTDDCGFSLKSAVSSNWDGEGYSAELWSATKAPHSYRTLVTIYFYSNKSWVHNLQGIDRDNFSIRCIKD